MHYWRVLRGGEPGEAAVRQKRYDPICVMDGCGRKHASAGLCRTHLSRVRRHGNPYVGGCWPGSSAVREPAPRSWSICAWLVEHEGWDQDDEDTA